MNIESRKTCSRLSTKTLVKVAILSAIAYILMFISAPIPGIFPEFLKLDISDIPAIFGGMAMGPVAGFMIVVIKNLLQLITATTTGGIGEIANILIGGTYVFILCYSYERRSDIKGVLTGFVVGTIGMAVVGGFMNYFVMLPFYGNLMGLDAIIGMGSVINPKVHDLLTFTLWMIVPFNIVKATMMSLITLPLYKKMAALLKK